MRHVIREAAKQYEEECEVESARLGRSAFRRLFLTFTYAANTRGKPCDLSECVRHIRQWAARRGVHVRRVWVGELQKRGALHYHVLLWLPRHLRLPMLDVRGWWPHGMTKIETARNAVGYLVKYASKCRPEDLKRLRKGMRLHGHGGGFPAWREYLRDKLRSRWITKLREVERMDAWIAEVEAEADAQEREEAHLLHLWWPEQYPAPDDLEPDNDFRTAEEAEADYYAELDAKHEKQDRLDAMPRSGRALLARVIGGYVDRVIGEFYPTPYEATVERGLVTLRLKEVPAPC
ncbi:MAG: hypothetical protein ABI132_03500 [Rhodanobacteraceae bacterium]